MTRPSRQISSGRRSHRQAGSALVATLAVVALLSFLVLLIARMLRTDQEDILMREARLESLSLADAGIALDSHPAIKRGDPALIWRSDNGTSYEVHISSEDARLNPNTVIQRGDTQFLKDLFQTWGIDMDTASAIVDAMEDWIDEDDMESLNGAEADAYSELGLPGLPPNRPFQNVREMSFVRGAEILDQYRPGWESLFSTRASGTIDLFDASAELISVACGVPREQADRFVELRWGDDMLPETEDDPAMNGVSDALAMLGQTTVPEDVLNSRVSFKSGLMRIDSTGRVGRVSRTMAAIIQKGSNRPVLIWRGEVPESKAGAPPEAIEAPGGP